MEHCAWGSSTNPSDCTAAVVAVKGKRLIACVEDAKILRSKKNLYESKGRSWVVERAREFGFSEDEVTVLCCDGLTTEEHNQFTRENPNLIGVYKGHALAKKYGDHHLKHALNSYYQSGYKDAAILVADGCDYPGGTSIALYKAIEDKVTLVKSWDTTHSLGLWYALGCVSCGFKWYHPGKLMAASSFSYNRTKNVRDRSVFSITPTGEIEDAVCEFFLDSYKDTAPNVGIQYTEKLKSLLDKNLPNNPKKFDFRYVNRAYLFQSMFTGAMFNLIRYAKQVISSNNLCLAGGCAGNVITNGEIIRSGLYKDIFIPPMHDDAGNAIGAAIIREGLELHEPLVYNSYTYPKPKEYSKEIAPAFLADLIRKGQIVAWFEGGSEYGPRALCHRSILANPEAPYMAYRLNEIKNREYWRPFAPVIIDKCFSTFFNVSRIYEPHKYMLATEYLHPLLRDQYNCITARDGSSRPQVLVKGNPQNEVLYNLMDSNNLPLLINTSMNGRGEPICETPEDAIKFAEKNKDVMLVFVQSNKIFCKNT